MFSSTVDDCPVCVLFSNPVNRVRAIVMFSGGASTAYVQYLVLCAGAVVLIVGVCLLFMCLRLAIVGCSALGTDGVDIVGNC